MYTPHPNFPAPPDVAKVWRYFTFAGLLSLIAQRTLYFASLTLLKQIDPLEGVWPESDYMKYLKRPEDIEEFKTISDLIAEITFVNCWHLNEYEDVAMWARYGEQFAIQSTFGRLKNSFPDDKIHVGKVGYINHLSDVIHRPKKNHEFLLPMRKHRSYASEREIRVILVEYPPYDQTQNPNYPYRGRGIPIRVDVENLIEAIYVSSRLPEWHTDLLRDIMARYSLTSIRMEKSVLGH